MNGPMGPNVVINGVGVDAGAVIDALVGQIAQQALEIASLRAQAASWSALAYANVTDPAQSSGASEGSTGTNDGMVILPEDLPDPGEASGWPLEAPNGSVGA